EVFNHAVDNVLIHETTDSVEIVRALLAAGVSPDLHSPSTSPPILKLINASGCQVARQIQLVPTATILHLLRLLVEHGANVHTTVEGEPLLAVATRCRVDPLIIQLLMSFGAIA